MRRRVRLVVWGVELAILATLLHLLGLHQVRTPVGAYGVGEGSFPVVEVAGLGSDGSRFGELTAALQARGVTVLDFDPTRDGVQALRYRPGDPDVTLDAGTRIPDLAVSYVLPEIRAALTRAGLDPDTQRVDVVAHSMGGLLVRYLIEHPVDGWDQRVDDLVMVGTPNHGSRIVYWETRGGGPFDGVGSDMAPGSAFLDALGYAEPVGQTCTAIGGDPWLFRWLRYGGHGFDDQVPAESPFLAGAAVDTFASFHGRLLLNREVIDLIVATLAAR